MRIASSTPMGLCRRWHRYAPIETQVAIVDGT
jgi:hypothetical protein